MYSKLLCFVSYSLSLCQVGAENSQTLASIANAVQIQVMNYIYSFIANALSERENHRTDTQVSELKKSTCQYFLERGKNLIISFRGLHGVL